MNRQLAAVLSSGQDAGETSSAGRGSTNAGPDRERHGFDQEAAQHRSYTVVLVDQSES